LIQRGEETFIRTDEVKVNDILHSLITGGGELISLVPRKETLEDLYVKSIEKQHENHRPDN
jgi:hypothetical protein